MNPSLARSSTSLFRSALRRHSHLPAPRIPQQSLVRLAPTARPFSTSQASMSVQAITSYDEFKKLVSGEWRGGPRWSVELTPCGRAHRSMETR